MFSCALYASSDELVTRLRRSIINYKGQPVYVEDIDNKNLVVRSLTSGDRELVKSNNEELEIGAFNLGYLNSSHGLAYIHRRAVRMYKQGICPENTGGRSADGQIFSISRDTMLSRPFLDMLVNKYPLFVDCVGGVNYSNPFSKGVSAKAFHKHLAVEGGKLFFKGHLVGDIRGDRTFSLRPEKGYLRESIEECLNECR